MVICTALLRFLNHVTARAWCNNEKTTRWPMYNSLSVSLFFTTGRHSETKMTDTQ